jgi:beta-fructofuranosidase
VWAGELYGELEVPQVVNIEGTWYLIFCTAKHHFTEAYRTSGRAHPVTGTHYLMADSPTGPWRLPGDRFLVGDDVGRIYSGKLHQANDGRWYFFGFLNYDAQGRFIGELTDPLPVHRLEDGRLRVDASRYGIPNNDEAPAEVPVRSNACN